MADPFETVILNMQRLGFFKFLFPYMLTAAIFYGLLRKSQIFGPPERNITVNGIVALVAAFMVWSYPIISGVDIQLQLSTFFVQGTIAVLVVMVGLMITGMFAPANLPEHLSKKFGGKMWGGILVLGLLIGAGVFVSSGLMNVFFPSAMLEEIPSDMIWTAVFLVFMVIIVVAIVFAVGREEKPKEKE
jgi:hypothetical protein